MLNLYELNNITIGLVKENDNRYRYNMLKCFDIIL